MCVHVKACDMKISTVKGTLEGERTASLAEFLSTKTDAHDSRGAQVNKVEIRKTGFRNERTAVQKGLIGTRPWIRIIVYASRNVAFTRPLARSLVRARATARVID